MQSVKPRIITVSQLNTYAKSVLEGNPILSSLLVTGEISDFRRNYYTNHLYFQIKDEKSAVSVVMFASYARNLQFEPKDGLKVTVYGKVSLYEPRGTFQINALQMFPEGVGELTIAFSQLKEKLQKEGLFDTAHKKPIPKLPRNIGVVTSQSGDAFRDIKNVIGRRFPKVNVIICHSSVQGANAPKELINGIRSFNRHKCADVIIIGRGGGSMEDLWCFNDEELAREIYNSEIPVISAVGHEPDFTICDFVADLRAPTPSAGAELAVPNLLDLYRYYDSKRRRIEALAQGRIDRLGSQFSKYEAVLERNSPDKLVLRKEKLLQSYAQRMENAINNRFSELEKSVNKHGAKLETLNPVTVLRRGYAYAQKNGKIISSVKELKTDDIIKITLQDGSVKAKVIE